MGILQYVEQTEGISLLMSRIEEDNLIPRGIIVFLVPGEKHVGTQVREHLADAVDAVSYTHLTLPTICSV